MKLKTLRIALSLVVFLLLSSNAFSGWEQVGGSLNIDPNRDASYARVYVLADIPYVSWIGWNASGYANVYVKKYNGVEWVQVGDMLNFDINQHASEPSIAFKDSTPFVAYQEGTDVAAKVFVKYLNGSNWEAIGNSLNVFAFRGAFSPQLSIVGNVFYVVFSQDDLSWKKTIYMKHYDSSNWVLDGGSLNFDQDHNASAPSLAFSGSTPYVAWC